jgi:hypothetical protein
VGERPVLASAVSDADVMTLTTADHRGKVSIFAI